MYLNLNMADASEGRSKKNGPMDRRRRSACLKRVKR